MGGEGITDLFAFVSTMSRAQFEHNMARVHSLRHIILPLAAVVLLTTPLTLVAYRMLLGLDHRSNANIAKTTTVELARLNLAEKEP